MTTEERKNTAELQQLQERGHINQKNASVSTLADSLKALDKFGGFQLFKGLIKGLDNMDPRRKAAKSIYLSESKYEESRNKLKEELQIWLDTIDGDHEDAQEIIETCQHKKNIAEENLSQNLKNIRSDISDMEKTYRSLDSFFANAGQGKIDCLTLANINKSELTSYDSADTEFIQKNVHDEYDDISLRRHYSMLVLPGYLGDADNVRKWGKFAYDNKVLLVTDFEDNSLYDDFDSLKNDIEEAYLQSQDTYMSHVLMTCNYLLGRKKSEIANELDDLYIPGSAALAGKMSNVNETVISQGIAGVKYGTLDNVKGARLNLRKSELTALINLGVIPMIESEGRTMAFSNRTLYSGGTDLLQEYPIVRVFDWIGKEFQHFFDGETFRNWSQSTKAELQEAVHVFLSSQKGPGRLIENYSLKGINRDKDTGDISIQVELKPYYATRNFLIELKGHQDENNVQSFSQNVQ